MLKEILENMINEKVDFKSMLKVDCEDKNSEKVIESIITKKITKKYLKLFENSFKLSLIDCFTFKTNLKIDKDNYYVIKFETVEFNQKIGKIKFIVNNEDVYKVVFPTLEMGNDMKSVLLKLFEDKVLTYKLNSDLKNHKIEF